VFCVGIVIAAKIIADSQKSVRASQQIVDCGVSTSSFRVALLDATCNRTTFSSGSEPLDRYFQQHVTQDIRRRITACFVALTGEDIIAGYYTLAAGSVPLTDLPSNIGRKLPRYPLVPAVRMGRLAVDRNFTGQGLGGALLADALHRASDSDIAAYALMVDAQDEAATAFYRHHGFIQLPHSLLTLFLPLATAKRCAWGSVRLPLTLPSPSRSEG